MVPFIALNVRYRNKRKVRYMSSNEERERKLKKVECKLCRKKELRRGARRVRMLIALRIKKMSGNFFSPP
jgi:hypothetical protein